jgi:hypothetical protein
VNGVQDLERPGLEDFGIEGAHESAAAGHGLVRVQGGAGLESI